MRLFAQFVRYALRWRHWPSPVQREFMRGDPHGIVRAHSEAITAEIKAEDEIRKEGGPL